MALKEINPETVGFNKTQPLENSKIVTGSGNLNTAQQAGQFMKDATITDAVYATQTAVSSPVENVEDLADTVVSAVVDASDAESADVESETGENSEFGDSWSYETPRPWLSIEQAARMLGRSTRAVERSIMGRWGNQLPEGWSARRVRIDEITEWRIVPPPGFRIKHNRRDQGREEGDVLAKTVIEDVEVSPLDDARTDNSLTENARTESATEKARTARKRAEAAAKSEKNDDQPFSFEKFFHSAGRMAQKELASFGLAVRAPERPIDVDVEHATIVIDRSDEVEKLLRELAETRKELAVQTRMHLEDLRVMHEMQASMRLLEVNARETSELKEDLTAAQIALREHRAQYQAFLALPWYKRLFRKNP